MADSTFDPATTVISDIKGDYTLDPTHTRLGFSTRHAMVTTVRGQFKDFAGEAVVDTANPAASKVEVTIQAASIDTGVADRDGHLQQRRLLRRRDLPRDHLRLHRRHARRRRLDDHRRPHHQGRHQADHPRLRVDRLRPRPVRQPPHRLRGQGRPQPQGLGPDLERRARDRRLPGVGQDQARVRHLRHRQVTRGRSDPAKPGRSGRSVWRSELARELHTDPTSLRRRVSVVAVEVPGRRHFTALKICRVSVYPGELLPGQGLNAGRGRAWSCRRG